MSAAPLEVGARVRLADAWLLAVRGDAYGLDKRRGTVTEVLASRPGVPAVVMVRWDDARSEEKHVLAGNLTEVAQ